MNYSVIRYILGSVLCFEGVFLLLPAVVAAIYGESCAGVYLAAALCSVAAGFAIRLKKPKSKVFYSKEGFVAVVFSWMLLSLVGAVPLAVTGEYPSYVDALFDTISGFTTTGASVLPTVGELTRATAFWRCFTHWVGGMGVLVFIMAVLPLSGGSNMHLMRAESPGPSVGKLVPKIKRTAMILYGIYILITLLEVVSLLFAGMSFYESLTLSFSTAGTGGFGLVDSSIASYSIPVQAIITVFMLLCSVNFNSYYLLLIKKPREGILKNEELHVFLTIVFASAAAIAVNIRGAFDSLAGAFHTALFQVATVISTTGFATTDFNEWPTFSRAVLMVLMFVGACAGSTGGGFKVSRLLLICRSTKNELLSMTHPRSVHRVSLNGHRVEESVVKTAHCYLLAYVMIVLVSFLCVSLDGFDMTTSFSAVMATLNNVGPGFNIVGPTGNYGSFSVFSKAVFMVDMLVGRLELFPVLALFAPGMWKLPVRRTDIRKMDDSMNEDV